MNLGLVTMHINKLVDQYLCSRRRKWSFHMISQIHLIFEEMCFDRFLHFILSFSFVRSCSCIVIMIIEGWDAVMWKTSPSTNGLLHAMCMYPCRRYTTYTLVLFFSFLFCYIFFLYTISSIGIYTTIYLELFPSTCLNKCARSWSSVRELLGKVASLITTTSIIPLAVRVIGIESISFSLYTLYCCGEAYDEKR